MKIKEPEFQWIAYAYWYSKIKERTKCRIITIDLLKDIFNREIICDDNKEHKGGNKRGIPKKFLYPIINDMRALKLIKRINHSTYEIITSDCEKKLKNPFPFD